MDLEPEEYLIASPPTRVNQEIQIRLVHRGIGRLDDDTTADLIRRLHAARAEGNSELEAAILHEAVQVVESDVNIELAVIVGQDANRDDLDNAWGAIEKARNALNKYQGKSTPFLRQAVRGRYLRMAGGGLGPGHIANSVNKDFGVSLCIELVEKAHSARTRRGLELALCIFQAMRVKAKGTKEQLWETIDLVGGHTLREIEANGELWNQLRAAVRREWFTRDNVEYAMQAWSKEEELYGHLVASPPRPREVTDLDALFEGASFGREANPLWRRLMTDRQH
jgi:hypothetical protein